MRYFRFLFLLLLLGLLSLSMMSCSVVSGILPGLLATRTATAIPATATITPSATPSPTHTATPTPSPSPTPTLTPTPEPATLLAVGDISICGQEGDDQTAALLADIPGDVVIAGDASNESGTLQQFEKCFDPSWGQYKNRLHPSPGNHEYKTAGAEGYFQYFGAAAGSPGEGWYSFDYGGWHIVMLNSNCDDVACGPHSEQVAWLQADLAASQAQCTLAVWHHPRWSSALAGSDGRMSPAYRALYAAGAEIVIGGHEHSYERLMPLDPEGKVDLEHGIRQFVVGTGGVNWLPFSTILPESEVRHTGTFGLLKLSLYPDRYQWEFVPVVPGEFTDTGEGQCH